MIKLPPSNLKKVLINFVFSGFTFFILSIVNLWNLGIIVQNFGFNTLGLLALIRNISHFGLGSIFDLSTSENTTFLVAKQLASKSRELRFGRLSVLFIGNIIGAFVLGLILFIFSEKYLPNIIASAETADLANTIDFKILAFIIPFGLVSLFAEAIIKGFEKFSIIRILEICGSLTFVGCTVFSILYDKPTSWLVTALLFIWFGRSICSLTIGCFIFFNQFSKFDFYPQTDDWIYSSKRATAFYPGKLISAVQQQTIPLFLSFWFGLSAVGFYELATRIPKFFKSAFSFCINVLTPYLVKKRELGESAKIGELYQYGSIILQIMLIPTIFIAIALTEPLSIIWINDTHTDLYIWMSIAMMSLLVVPLLSYRQTFIVHSSSLLIFASLFSLLRVIAIYTAAFLLSDWVDEKAIITIEVLAWLTIGSIEMSVISKKLEFKGVDFRIYVKIFSIALTIGIFTFFFWDLTNNGYLAGLVSAILLISSWLFLWLSIFPVSLRKNITQYISSL